jgi:hypothetical protein
MYLPNIDPIETERAVHALEEVSKWLEEIQSDESKGNKYFAALNSVDRALVATRKYLKHRREGGERDPNSEDALSGLWLDAASEIQPYDRELANLCRVKGHGWADEAVWDEPQYRDLPVQVNQMLDHLMRLAKLPAPDDHKSRPTKGNPNAHEDETVMEHDPQDNSQMALPGSPLGILRAAINAVPAVKYALGVVGIIAAISIAGSLTNYRVAAIGTVVMLILMTALVIFAAATRLVPKYLAPAAVILVYSFLILTVATAMFLLTSVFFKWPINLQNWILDTSFTPKPAPTTNANQISITDTGGVNKGYLRGKVVKENEDPIPDALIEIEELPRQTFQTTSDGGFYIENIPKNLGDRVRIYVSSKGYKKRNEYVTLPGPVRIRLEK